MDGLAGAAFAAWAESATAAAAVAVSTVTRVRLAELGLRVERVHLGLGVLDGRLGGGGVRRLGGERDGCRRGRGQHGHTRAACRARPASRARPPWPWRP